MLVEDLMRITASQMVRGGDGNSALTIISGPKFAIDVRTKERFRLPFKAYSELETCMTPIVGRESVRPRRSMRAR